MLDGLNFKEFVAFLSAFSSRASLQQKVECKTYHIHWLVPCSILTVAVFSISCNCTYISFSLSLFPVIFKVYDSDGNGKVTFNEMLDILRDLTGQFISEHQREVNFTRVVIFLYKVHVFLNFCLACNVMLEELHGKSKILCLIIE